MDLIGEERGRLTRAAAWLQATRAELVGLAVLLGGCVAVTATVWLSTAGDLPGDGPSGAEARTRGGETPVVDEPSIGEAVDPTDLAGRVDEDGAWEEGDTEEYDGPPPADGHEPPDDLTVHVSGAVAEPGLVTVRDGARVGDAVAAAGGAHDEAEVHLINLAHRLADGDHVHVPREGEDPPPTPATPPGGGGGDGAGDQPVDLNRAGVEELEALPGIGPARAQTIVEHREAHGPFDEPGDLRAVSGIGEATFQRLAELVTVS